MSVYIIAQLKFTRRELYDRYQSRFMGVFSKFKGKLLVADAHPVVLEGEWPRDKVVIMEFPDDAAAQEFQNSPEYQEISVDRKAGADAIVLTVRGLSCTGRAGTTSYLRELRAKLCPGSAWSIVEMMVTI
jgi:uncharacterized protein (DUF1330 family)